MAFCSNCGHQFADGDKFCYKCGAKAGKVASAQREQRRVGFEGEIRKCPNCGDIIDAYETVCEACGFEIRGRKTTSVVHELSLKLERTDDLDKKDELIRTFYIPNTREDIHEFFILALSNIKIGGTNTNAWMVKLEQAYQKAELSFSSTHEFERLTSLYNEAQAINRKNSTFGFLKSVGRCFKSGYAWALLAFALGVILLLTDDASMASIFLLLAGVLIAEFTLLGNDNKKKNGKKGEEN